MPGKACTERDGHYLAVTLVFIVLSFESGQSWRSPLVIKFLDVLADLGLSTCLCVTLFCHSVSLGWGGTGRRTSAPSRC